ncbi:MAG: carboxypeptidase-like regulatory domain-containing protein [Nannocystaceae bacterium]|nr:carboxypeptidase-like regulatory domain-containing protein [Nannocystaceae bacterium]
MPSESSVVQSCFGGEQLEAVEVIVMGDDDRPLAGLAVVLQSPSKGLQSDLTDTRGRCRFEGIPPGERTRVALADLDAAAWELVTTLPLSASAAVSTAAASWSAFTPRDVPPRAIEVAPGQCLVKLGYLHGLLPQTLWDHNAGRFGPHHSKVALTPGMQLELPTRTLRWIDVPAARLAVLHRIGLPVVMTLRVVDAQARPWAGCAYALSFEGSSRPIATQLGRTDRAGRLHAPVLPDVSRGLLTIEPRGGGRQWRFALHVGALRPADEPEGAASRLWNMGFREGHSTLWREGDVLATFQREGLEQEPAPLDAPSAAALVDWHGS